jgi:hypothetical protein
MSFKSAKFLQKLKPSSGNDASESDVAKETPPLDDNTGPVTDAAKKGGPWDEAYKSLTKDFPRLVEHYEAILAKEEEDEGGESEKRSAIGISHSESRLASLASKKLEAIDESRLRIRLGSKTIVVNDGVDQVLKVVIAAKEFVSGVVASEPHAALAWTGVCLVLPVSSSICIFKLSTYMTASSQSKKAVRRCLGWSLGNPAHYAPLPSHGESLSGTWRS